MENQELQKLSNSNQNLTPSLTLNTAVRNIDPKTSIKAISDTLLRIGTLYQIPNFSEANALILAEWTAENFKHKTLGLVLDALKNPSIIYEDGSVTRSWRLTPETVAIWIEKRSTEREQQRQLEETRMAHDKLLEPAKFSDATNSMVEMYLKQLQEGMAKKMAIVPSQEVTRIDLILRLLNQYKKESVDPITGNLYPDALDEREWLLGKGYFIEDGNLKEL